MEGFTDLMDYFPKGGRGVQEIVRQRRLSETGSVNILNPIISLINGKIVF